MKSEKLPLNDRMENDALLPVAAGTTRSRRGVSSSFWVIAAALVAFALKLCIALNTEGTNDVHFFFQFGRYLSEHGLQWTYTEQAMFNHPPLIAYFLRGIYSLAFIPLLQENGLTFPFLLRLPGIIADFAVVLLVLRIRRTWPLPTWSLIVLALSPVSLMVSGFHGNTDSALVLLVLAAAYFGLRERPILCGIALALSCGIKIIPVLVLPIFFFFWYARRRTFQFALPFVGTVTLLSIQPLLGFPAAYFKNVLAYGSYWGIWGISYWLRLTHWSEFSVIDYRNLPLAETVVSTLLKLVIVAVVLVIAWRRRFTDARGLFHSIAYAWLVFFIFAPGVGAQYLVWLMPFVLVLSPVAFAYVTLACSCFLFFFYNAIAAGLPWNLAISTNAIADRWTAWTNWPWLAFIAVLAVAWRQARGHNPALRLFSLDPLHERTLPPC